MILVLVDVDNLLGARTSFPSAFSLGADASELAALVPPKLTPDAAAREVTVSMAMNLVSAGVFASWEALQALGSRLGRATAPNALSTRIEVALTLQVPESADQALRRLLLCRPGDEPEPELTEVHLLTSDAGLADQIHEMIGALGERGGAAPCWRWRFRRPIERSGPASAVTQATGEGRWLRPTTVLTSKALCAEARQRPVQCPTDWAVLLETLRRSPWALSQVGVTFHDGEGKGDGSVRGVARLARHLGPTREGPAQLACSPLDGLEIGHGSFAKAWTFKATAAQPQAASVGPGAVRLTWTEQQDHGLTVRTALPVWLIKELAGRGVTLRAGPTEPRLDEELALGTQVGLLGGPRAEVRLTSYGDHLAAKITRGANQVWWTAPGQDRAPKGRYRVPGAQSLCPRTLHDVVACLAIAPGSRLYLRSPVPRGATIELVHDLRPGQIGLGWWRGGKTKEGCAVLARSRLQRGPLTCTPLQNVAHAKLVRVLRQAGLGPLEAEGVAPLLQELPLLTDLTAGSSDRAS